VPGEVSCRSMANARLRRDELEVDIVVFLRTGRAASPAKRPLSNDKRATRTEAIAAWTELEQLEVPKDYASWIKARAKRKAKNR
jgi:hypothetical protein